MQELYCSSKFEQCAQLCIQCLVSVSSIVNSQSDWTFVNSMHKGCSRVKLLCANNNCTAHMIHNVKMLEILLFYVCVCVSETYLWSIFSVSLMARINDAIGADSDISPLYNCCVKYGALSFRSRMWIIAEEVAETEAIFVARIVKL